MILVTGDGCATRGESPGRLAAVETSPVSQVRGTGAGLQVYGTIPYVYGRAGDMEGASVNVKRGLQDRDETSRWSSNSSREYLIRSPESLVRPIAGFGRYLCS